MSTEVLNTLAPVMVFGICAFAITISVLLKHQRYMAELMHRPSVQPDALVQEIQAMRAEIGRLQDKVDTLAAPSGPPALADRLSGPPASVESGQI